MPNHFDLIIVGGGMVGASLAVALADCDCRIAIIEAIPDEKRLRVERDARSIVLSFGSSRIFSSLGLWQQLKSDAVAVNKIHVSDRGRFGVTRFNASDVNRSALGYVVPAHSINRCLHAALQHQANVTWFCPVALQNLQRHDHQYQVILADGQQLITDCVVAADGAESKARELLQIETQILDYHQVAIVANVTLGRSHENTAYERFTPNGPIAFLPLAQQQAALVYTAPNDQREMLLELSDQEFLQRLQMDFGYRLGRFQAISRRFAFPLQLTTAKTQVKPGAVLLGNAAHSLHPIAAQGFNLSLRDAVSLAQSFAVAIRDKISLGDEQLLRNYYHSRQHDQQRMLALTDGIHKIFHFNLLPWSWLRDMGLVLLEHSPLLKSQFAKHSMGLAGKLPNLSCDIPLLEV